MYAYTRSAALSAAVDFKSEGDDVRLHTWRKHPNLHGWMEDLYRAKGGTEPDFNCVNLQLTEQDLEQLKSDIAADRLPVTCGFFFGNSDGSERDDDLLFIEKATAALGKGFSVYYTSWW